MNSLVYNYRIVLSTRPTIIYILTIWHIGQKLAQGLAGAKMRLISFQPYQTLHCHLVQSIIALPSIWPEMADACVAFYGLPDVVVSWIVL